jgi:hypothetical protein
MLSKAYSEKLCEELQPSRLLNVEEEEEEADGEEAEDCNACNERSGGESDDRLVQLYVCSMCVPALSGIDVNVNVKCVSRRCELVGFLLLNNLFLNNLSRIHIT